MSDDYFASREFYQVVNEGLVPKLVDSAVCVSLAPPDGGIDAKFAVELGAMIMLNKPILVVVEPGQEISDKLRLVSDRVIYADPKTDEGRERLEHEIAEFAEEFG